MQHAKTLGQCECHYRVESCSHCERIDKKIRARFDEPSQILHSSHSYGFPVWEYFMHSLCHKIMDILCLKIARPPWSEMSIAASAATRYNLSKFYFVWNTGYFQIVHHRRIPSLSLSFPILK